MNSCSNCFSKEKGCENNKFKEAIEYYIALGGTSEIFELQCSKIKKINLKEKG